MADQQAGPDQQQAGPRVRGPGTGGVLIGRPFGVPIYISASWLLFVAFITVQFAPVVADAVPGIGGARFVVAAGLGVFLGLSVLAHEVAHCVVARRLGIPIERISLSFLAGHSALAREPETPARSSAVAVAGPATNLLIAGGSFAAFVVVPSGSIGSVLAAGLTWANAVVGIYNLLPGLPLDGGQLLRAAVWRVTGNARTGTVGAAWSGRVIAGGTAAAAILILRSGTTEAQVSVLWALLIAAMLWISSTQVLRQQAVRDRLPGLSARTLSRSAISVAANLPLAEAVRRAQEAHAQGIIIVDDEGRPTGVVKEAAVTATPAQRRPWIDVGTMARSISGSDLIEASLSGEALLMRLQSGLAAEYVVVDDGLIYGVLATADVARALAGAPAGGQLARGVSR